MAFPTTTAMIKRAEERLGATFPPAYAERLLRHNGGEVVAADDTWHLFPVFDDTDRKRISRTCNDVVRETSRISGFSGFPSNALAVGTNGAGDYLLLLRAGMAFADPVFWWDHETGRTNSAANSFADL